MRGALGRVPTRARLLPPDITDFTGRPAELAVLTAAGSDASQASALFTVTGAGGTGKTALAVRAARLAGAAYPDAHLYADLGGHSGAPVAVPDVLRRFLRALGAEGPLPADPDELVGMFRTALAGQRALVVLDDATDEAQVRPLLPAGPDALAVVTSRNWLGGLAGAVPLRLGPMPEAEAAAMLARVLGPRWTADEDAADLLALCGHLPLAIRIAAARLLSRPQMTVADLCDQLRDEGRRLRRLTAGDITVHGVLASSYEALEPGDQRVFRRLALLRGPDFCTEGAAHAAGIAREEAREALDRLADRSVVRAEPRPGRYSLHSLARLFAADRLAAEEDPDAVRAAQARHLEWVLARLHDAADLIDPRLVRLPRQRQYVAGATARTAEEIALPEPDADAPGGPGGKMWPHGTSAASTDPGRQTGRREPAASTDPGRQPGQREQAASTSSGRQTGLREPVAATTTTPANAGRRAGETGPATATGSALPTDPASFDAALCDPCSACRPGARADAVPADRESALSWLDAECHNLLALVRHHRRAGEAGVPTVCWTVPDALRGYFLARRHLREWTKMAGIGLSAAHHAGNLRAQAAMHLGLGMAEFAAGRLKAAEEHYHRTVELGLGSGWREGEAAAYRNLADVALLHGDGSASEKYLSLWADLSDAFDRYAESQKAGWPAAAPGTGAGSEDPGTDADTRLPEPDLPDVEWSILSHREQTVARLVVQGLTNQQIAKRIRCSPETVKFHLRNIFRKLGIGSRVEIARFVLASDSRA